MTTQIQEVAPVKLQAPAIQAQADIVIEADGNKGVLMQRLVDSFKKLAAAEDALSKGLAADAVLSIVPLLKLPVKNRPKYAAIAEQITLAMGRGDIMARTVAKLPDETTKDRFGKTPAYKQQATRWVNMARWESGLFNKAEEKHQERTKDWELKVNYHSKVYTSPVTMLRDGVAYTTVHQAFRNVVAPAFVDFAKMDAKATVKAARTQVEKFSVKIRTTNDDGDVVKGKVLATESAPVTTGAVIGLLAGCKAPITQSQFDQIHAALLMVKPGEKPAETEK